MPVFPGCQGFVTVCLHFLAQSDCAKPRDRLRGTLSLLLVPDALRGGIIGGNGRTRTGVLGLINPFSRHLSYIPVLAGKAHNPAMAGLSRLSPIYPGASWMLLTVGGIGWPSVPRAATHGARAWWNRAELNRPSAFDGCSMNLKGGKSCAACLGFHVSFSILMASNVPRTSSARYCISVSRPPPARHRWRRGI